jgi:ligand-binding sensor domain-containing protein/signal transduction histidine kinase
MNCRSTFSGLFGLVFAVLGGLGGPAGLSGQSAGYIIEHLSIEDGLSQSVVQTILQDRDGFLWFGTQDGLNRYNGYQFTIYKNEPDNPNSLTQNYITALCEDDNGVIWIGTEKGLNSFQEGRIQPWFESGDSNLLRSHLITAMCTDRSGGLWVGTLSDGLRRIDLRTHTVTPFRTLPDSANSLSDDRIRSLFCDEYDTLWVGTLTGLNRFKDGRVTRFLHGPGDPGSLSHNNIRAIVADSGGGLWVGTQGGLNRYERSGRFRAYGIDDGGLTDERIVSLCFDRDRALWIGTEHGGLHRLHDGRWTRFQKDPADPSSLSHNDVEAIVQDRSGNVWAGTMGGGLNKLRPNRFTIFSHNPFDSNSLSSSDVWAVLEDREGNLWIGTRGGGLCRFRDGTFTRYRHRPGDAHSLSSDDVTCVFEDRRGELWIGTEDGLNRFDGKRFHVFRRDASDPASLSSSYISCIAEDSTGTLWFGTFGGGVVRRVNGRFEVFRHSSEPGSLSSDDVFTLTVDRQGRLWVGTFDGLNRFDGQRFTTWTAQSHPAGLSQSTVMCVLEDPDGSLWIGTDGGGLNHMRNGTFDMVTEKDGLPNNLVYGILLGPDSCLWLSTNAGLCRFDPRKQGRERFHKFDSRDGLPSSEFNQGAYRIGRDGKLYFGGIKGLVSVDPRGLVPRKIVFPVYITAFKKFDQVVLFEREIMHLKGIEISHRDNFFAFEFAALDYTSPQKNQYAYRLKGFDEDWIYSGSRRYVSYTNLDGGRYVFYVRAANSEGVWNEKPARLEVIIHPPFWKTLWFQLTAAALFGVVGYAFFQSRVQAIKKRNQVLEERVRERTRMVEEKNRELESKNDQIRRQQDQLIQSEKLSSLGRLVAGMSHEINNPLNFTYGNAVNLDLELQDIQEILKAVREQAVDPAQVEELARRIHGMWDMVATIKTGTERIKDIVVGLRDFSIMYESEKTDIHVRSLVDYLVGLVRSQERRNVRIRTEHGNVASIKGFYGQLSHAIMNILRNAIEAAQRRSGKDGEVLIRTYREGSHFVLAIRDNGPGIPENIRHKIFEPFFTTKAVGQGTGLGLSISYGIVRNHQGEINFETSAEGTEFRLILPMDAPGAPGTSAKLS